MACFLYVPFSKYHKAPLGRQKKLKFPSSFSFTHVVPLDKQFRTLTISYRDNFVRHGSTICLQFRTSRKIYMYAILYFIEDVYVCHFVHHGELLVCYIEHYGIFICIPFRTSQTIYMIATSLHIDNSYDNNFVFLPFRILTISYLMEDLFVCHFVPCVRFICMHAI